MYFSLNFVAIIHVPPALFVDGARVRPDVFIFSAYVVCNIIRKHCKALGISPKEELPKALARCLDSNDCKVCSLASEIAEDLGKRLARFFIMQSR